MKKIKNGLINALALLVLTFSVAANANDISAEIYVENDWLDASEDVLVYISLTNHGKKPAKVLKWYTAADGIEENLFRVSRDGQSLRSGDEDWLPVDAGATLSAEVDIASAWKLSLPGEYSLQLRNDISYRLAEHSDSLKIAAASCGVVRFLIF